MKSKHKCVITTVSKVCSNVKTNKLFTYYDICQNERLEPSVCALRKLLQLILKLEMVFHTLHLKKGKITLIMLPKRVFTSQLRI